MAVAGAKSLYSDLALSSEAREVVIVIEVTEAEAFAVEQDRGAGVDAVVYQYLIAPPAIAKRFHLVRRLQCEIVVGEKERQTPPRACELDQLRDVHIGADVEEWVVVRLEEVELLAPGPALEIEIGGHSGRR